jgi:NitT/TauT family transport system substrate-binding protein
VTTNIIVRTEFLEQHPDIVTAFLEGNEAALDFIAKDPAAAKTAVNQSLQSLTGSSLEQDVLDAAFADVEFTNDPLPATLATSADHAIQVGLLEKDALEAAGGLPGKLYSLDLLGEVLKA